jgi:hypothetical protein
MEKGAKVMASTSDENVTKILSEVYEQWSETIPLEHFVSESTEGRLGLPLAHAIEQGAVEQSPETASGLREVFEYLLDALDLVDTGFENMAQIVEETRYRFDIDNPWLESNMKPNPEDE